MDFNELKDEREALSNFLRSKIKTDVSLKGNKLLIDSENLSAGKLKRIVNKFVYHQNLNSKFWVELDGDTVKIKRFKHLKNENQEKKGTIPSTIKHGW